LNEVKANIQEINNAWTELRHIAMMRNVKLAVAFIVLNIVDAALTVVIADEGGYELLPIARYFLEQSTWTFWVFKIGMTLLFAFALIALSDKYHHQMHRMLFTLVIAMAGVCIFNGVGLCL